MEKAEDLLLIEVCSSDEDEVSEASLWSESEMAKSKFYTTLREQAKDIIFHYRENKTSIFPYNKLKDFCKESRRTFLDVNMAPTKAFIWKNLIQWLQAIKLSYKGLDVDLKYDEQFNIILVNFMEDYINYKCSLGNKTKNDKINEILMNLSVIFSNNSSYIIMTLLKIELRDGYSRILEPIFRKYLSDKHIHNAKELLSYLRLILCYKKWKKLVQSAEEKNEIDEIALGKCSGKNNGILPVSIPPVNENNSCFIIISDAVEFAVNKPENSTRVLLTIESMDINDAVNKYFRMYEIYLGRRPHVKQIDKVSDATKSLCKSTEKLQIISKSLNDNNNSKSSNFKKNLVNKNADNYELVEVVPYKAKSLEAKLNNEAKILSKKPILRTSNNYSEPSTSNCKDQANESNTNNLSNCIPEEVSSTTTIEVSSTTTIDNELSSQEIHQIRKSIQNNQNECEISSTSVLNENPESGVSSNKVLQSSVKVTDKFKSISDRSNFQNRLPNQILQNKLIIDEKSSNEMNENETSMDLNHPSGIVDNRGGLSNNIFEVLDVMKKSNINYSKDLKSLRNATIPKALNLGNNDSQISTLEVNFNAQHNRIEADHELEYSERLDIKSNLNKKSCINQAVLANCKFENNFFNSDKKYDSKKNLYLVTSKELDSCSSKKIKNHDTSLDKSKQLKELKPSSSVSDQILCLENRQCYSNSPIHSNESDGIQNKSNFLSLAVVSTDVFFATAMNKNLEVSQQNVKNTNTTNGLKTKQVLNENTLNNPCSLLSNLCEQNKFDDKNEKINGNNIKFLGTGKKFNEKSNVKNIFDEGDKIINEAKSLEIKGATTSINTSCSSTALNNSFKNSNSNKNVTNKKQVECKQSLNTNIMYPHLSLKTNDALTLQKKKSEVCNKKIKQITDHLEIKAITGNKDDNKTFTKFKPNSKEIYTDDDINKNRESYLSLSDPLFEINTIIKNKAQDEDYPQTKLKSDKNEMSEDKGVINKSLSDYLFQINIDQQSLQRELKSQLKETSNDDVIKDRGSKKSESDCEINATEKNENNKRNLSDFSCEINLIIKNQEENIPLAQMKPDTQSKEMLNENIINNCGNNKGEICTNFPNFFEVNLIKKNQQENIPSHSKKKMETCSKKISYSEVMTDCQNTNKYIVKNTSSSLFETSSISEKKETDEISIKRKPEANLKEMCEDDVSKIVTKSTTKHFEINAITNKNDNKTETELTQKSDSKEMLNYDIKNYCKNNKNKIHTNLSNSLFKINSITKNKEGNETRVQTILEADLRKMYFEDNVKENNAITKNKYENETGIQLKFKSEPKEMSNRYVINDRGSLKSESSTNNFEANAITKNKDENEIIIQSKLKSDPKEMSNHDVINDSEIKKSKDTAKHFEINAILQNKIKNETGVLGKLKSDSKEMSYDDIINNSGSEQSEIITKHFEINAITKNKERNETCVQTILGAYVGKMSFENNVKKSNEIRTNGDTEENDTEIQLKLKSDPKEMSNCFVINDKGSLKSESSTNNFKINAITRNKDENETGIQSKLKSNPKEMSNHDVINDGESKKSKGTTKHFEINAISEGKIKSKTGVLGKLKPDSKKMPNDDIINDSESEKCESITKHLEINAITKNKERNETCVQTILVADLGKISFGNNVKKSNEIRKNEDTEENDTEENDTEIQLKFKSDPKEMSNCLVINGKGSLKSESITNNFEVNAITKTKDANEIGIQSKLKSNPKEMSNHDVINDIESNKKKGTTKHFQINPISKGKIKNETGVLGELKPDSKEMSNDDIINNSENEKSESITTHFEINTITKNKERNETCVQTTLVADLGKMSFEENVKKNNEITKNEDENDTGIQLKFKSDPIEMGNRFVINDRGSLKSESSTNNFEVNAVTKNKDENETGIQSKLKSDPKEMSYHDVINDIESKKNKGATKHFEINPISEHKIKNETGVLGKLNPNSKEMSNDDIINNGSERSESITKNFEINAITKNKDRNETCVQTILVADLRKMSFEENVKKSNEIRKDEVENDTGIQLKFKSDPKEMSNRFVNDKGSLKSESSTNNFGINAITKNKDENETGVQSKLKSDPKEMSHDNVINNCGNKKSEICTNLFKINSIKKNQQENKAYFETKLKTYSNQKYYGGVTNDCESTKNNIYKKTSISIFETSAIMKKKEKDKNHIQRKLEAKLKKITKDEIINDSESNKNECSTKCVEKNATFRDKDENKPGVKIKIKSYSKGTSNDDVINDSRNKNSESKKKDLSESFCTINAITKIGDQNKTFAQMKMKSHSKEIYNDGFINDSGSKKREICTNLPYSPFEENLIKKNQQKNKTTKTKSKTYPTIDKNPLSSLFETNSITENKEKDEMCIQNKPEVSLNKMSKEDLIVGSGTNNTKCYQIKAIRKNKDEKDTEVQLKLKSDPKEMSIEDNVKKRNSKKSVNDNNLLNSLFKINAIAKNKDKNETHAQSKMKSGLKETSIDDVKKIRNKKSGIDSNRSKLLSMRSEITKNKDTNTACCQTILKSDSTKKFEDFMNVKIIKSKNNTITSDSFLEINAKNNEENKTHVQTKLEAVLQKIHKKNVRNDSGCKNRGNNNISVGITETQNENKNFATSKQLDLEAINSSKNFNSVDKNEIKAAVSKSLIINTLENEIQSKFLSKSNTDTIKKSLDFSSNTDNENESITKLSESKKNSKRNVLNLPSVTHFEIENNKNNKNNIVCLVPLIETNLLIEKKEVYEAHSNIKLPESKKISNEDVIKKCDHENSNENEVEFDKDLSKDEIIKLFNSEIKVNSSLKKRKEKFSQNDVKQNPIIKLNEVIDDPIHEISSREELNKKVVNIFSDTEVKVNFKLRKTKEQNDFEQNRLKSNKIVTNAANEVISLTALNKEAVTTNSGSKIKMNVVLKKTNQEFSEHDISNCWKSNEIIDYSTNALCGTNELIHKKQEKVNSDQTKCVESNIYEFEEISDEETDTNKFVNNLCINFYDNISKNCYSSKAKPSKDLEKYNDLGIGGNNGSHVSDNKNIKNNVNNNNDLLFENPISLSSKDHTATTETVYCNELNISDKKHLVEINNLESKLISELDCSTDMKTNSKKHKITPKTNFTLNKQLNGSASFETNLGEISSTQIPYASKKYKKNSTKELNKEAIKNLEYLPLNIQNEIVFIDQNASKNFEVSDPAMSKYKDKFDMLLTSNDAKIDISNNISKKTSLCSYQTVVNNAANIQNKSKIKNEKTKPFKKRNLEDKVERLTAIKIKQNDNKNISENIMSIESNKINETYYKSNTHELIKSKKPGNKREMQDDENKNESLFFCNNILDIKTLDHDSNKQYDDIKTKNDITLNNKKIENKTTNTTTNNYQQSLDNISDNDKNFKIIKNDKKTSHENLAVKRGRGESKNKLESAQKSKTAIIYEIFKHRIYSEPSTNISIKSESPKDWELNDEYSSTKNTNNDSLSKHYNNQRTHETGTKEELVKMISKSKSNKTDKFCNKEENDSSNMTHSTDNNEHNVSETKKIEEFLIIEKLPESNHQKHNKKLEISQAECVENISQSSGKEKSKKRKRHPNIEIAELVRILRLPSDDFTKIEEISCIDNKKIKIEPFNNNNCGISKNKTSGRGRGRGRGRGIGRGRKSQAPIKKETKEKTISIKKENCDTLTNLEIEDKNKLHVPNITQETSITIQPKSNKGRKKKPETVEPNFITKKDENCQGKVKELISIMKSSSNQSQSINRETNQSQQKKHVTFAVQEMETEFFSSEVSDDNGKVMPIIRRRLRVLEPFPGKTKHTNSHGTKEKKNNGNIKREKTETTNKNYVLGCSVQIKRYRSDNNALVENESKRNKKKFKDQKNIEFNDLKDFQNENITQPNFNEQQSLTKKDFSQFPKIAEFNNDFTKSIDQETSYSYISDTIQQLNKLHSCFNDTPIFLDLSPTATNANSTTPHIISNDNKKFTQNTPKTTFTSTDILLTSDNSENYLQADESSCASQNPIYSMFNTSLSFDTTLSFDPNLSLTNFGYDDFRGNMSASDSSNTFNLNCDNFICSPKKQNYSLCKDTKIQTELIDDFKMISKNQKKKTIETNEVKSKKSKTTPAKNKEKPVKIERKILACDTIYPFNQGSKLSCKPVWKRLKKDNTESLENSEKIIT